MVELTADRVEAVLDEVDALGVDAFLAEHGFGSPREYWLLSPVRPRLGPYPAKAVAAVALGWSDINGGYSKRDSACNVLERAGYLIVDADGQALDDSPASLSRQVDQKLAALGATEADALVKRRVGQDVFRTALLARWDEQCPVTGIQDTALLRASHIKAWSECSSDAERLDVNNGLLLSALWDAAFDRFLVTFADDGSVIVSRSLSQDAREALDISNAEPIWFDDEHLPYLAWHRAQFDALSNARKGR